MIRRRTLLGAAAGAGAALAWSGTAHAEGQVVIGCWGGDYADLLGRNIDTPLIAPKGIEAVQDIGSQDVRKAKMYAERVSRRGTLDVTCLADTDMYEMSVANLLENPTTELVPNLANAVPALHHPYAIPHIYSGMVVLYNPSKVSPAPKGFADLFDAKWRGRVGFSDINAINNIAAATLAAGGTMSDFGPGMKQLLAMRSLDPKIYPSVEALAVALKGEEIWMTPMWLARGFMWKKAGVPVAHVVPSEGATPVIFEAAVPRNAPDKANAWTYLNAMLDPAAQAAFADRMGYVPTVTNAHLPPELAAQIAFSPEDQANFKSPDYAYLAKNNAALQDFWNKQFKA
jgi:putative spermidine/putrescine transport system substrate-binding protein